VFAGKLANVINENEFPLGLGTWKENFQESPEEKEKPSGI